MQEFARKNRVLDVMLKGGKLLEDLLFVPRRNGGEDQRGLVFGHQMQFAAVLWIIVVCQFGEPAAARSVKIDWLGRDLIVYFVVADLGLLRGRSRLGFSGLAGFGY